MQKIGNSTSTANGAGEYSRGQPGSGIDATLITPEWLNAVQRELVNVIIGAGIALDPNDDAQVLTAIQAIQTAASTWAMLTGKPTTVSGFGITDAFTKTETSTAIQQAVAALVASSPAALDTLKELADALGSDPNFATTMTNALAGKASIASIQSQGATAFTSAGAAPAFTLTPSPAIAAYAAGQRFRVKFSDPGSGSDTLNVSGRGPKNLKQYDSTGTKVAAVIAQNQLSDVEYDGTDMVILDPLPNAPVLPYDYFSGFLLANNVTAPTTTIDVAPGAARDTTDLVNLKLSSTMRGILQAAGVWAAGDNQNKLDAGIKAISAWYHVFVIRKISDGTGDILFSLSATAPTLPAGYAGFRRISSIRTDASGNIIQFVNVGRYFTWKTPVADVTAVVTTATVFTLSVPPGVRTMARFGLAIYGNTDAAGTYTSPSIDNISWAMNASYNGGFYVSTTASDTGGVNAECIAENGQVRFSGINSVRVATFGWQEIE